ncbi:MAG TPA: 1,4-dihydroxy-6-naphthoate synthase [Phnomibacter sp.]|nr:1,4-dihydroxy-6-naphthoate synthase [Phnomibacter sp.]
MKCTLGFSPCPNDTFIFDALVNRKINTGPFEFEVVLEDVQTLNQWAQQGRLDITKISYGVLPKITQQYTVLQSGGALGKGVGPLLISAQPVPESMEQKTALVNSSVIAIPGADTTAHFLFSQAFPFATQKVFKRFDEIESFVASGQGLGVIIHENRFTYQQKGLHKIIDLGDYWEQSTGNPIPLGGIVMKRSINKSVIQHVDALIHRSVEYAFAHQDQLPDYVRSHAQEMSEEVMRKHIDLYVNDYSLSLGEQGRAAVMALMQSFTGSPVNEAFTFV